MDQVFPDDIENLQHDNFQLAFGITAYDGDTEPVEDPRYGRMLARYYTWGLGDSYQDIETHVCSDEELGLLEDKESSRFFEIYPNNLKDVQTYKKKLYCTDEKLKLQGDYNSERARRIELYFEKCSNQNVLPQGTCHSEQEITKYLQRKFIIVLQNEVKFNTREYGKDTRIKP